jgi:hypothetical protein
MVNREHGKKGTMLLEQVIDSYEKYICKVDRIKEQETHPWYRGTAATKPADTQDSSESSDL